jgi:hypothetical protein
MHVEPDFVEPLQVIEADHALQPEECGTGVGASPNRAFRRMNAVFLSDSTWPNVASRSRAERLRHDSGLPVLSIRWMVKNDPAATGNLNGMRSQPRW